MKVVHNNWKGALVAAVCFAVGVYAGPVASKAVGFLLPKALEHVSNTPIEDAVAHKNPFIKDPISDGPSPAQQAVDILRDRLHSEKPTLKAVARAWGIKGRLDCRVVEK